MPKEKAKRLTVAEKRAIAEKRDAAELLEFQAKRPQAWMQIWVKALELHILTRDMHELRESQDWFFHDFEVNVQDHYFTMNVTQGYSKSKITQEGLTPLWFEQINCSLDDGFCFRKNYLNEIEQKRIEAITRENKINVAKAKLSAEERALLGIT